MLFVPGWCCDGTAFQPQFDHFAETNAVTALDLRGCGGAIARRSDTQSRDLADDVAGFCGAVGIERPVLVGHSLGGMIAVELAGRRPSLPRALVLVDPGPIDWDPEMCRKFDSFAKQLAGPDGEEVRRRYVENMGARDPEVAGWIADMMSAIPLPIATAVIQHLTTWDGAGAMTRCDVPTLLLRTELDAERDGSAAGDQAGSDIGSHCRGRPLPPDRGARSGQCHDRPLPRARRVVDGRTAAPAPLEVLVGVLEVRCTTAFPGREGCWGVPASCEP